MSIDMTLQIDTTRPEDTLNLAAKIGAQLRGGEVIELVSDLGGGKTLFVRGLAQGMGSKDRVASPTFTISREYKAKGCELHHYDFYRLQDAGPGVVVAEMEESIKDERVAVAIEWSDSVSEVLPEDRLRVEIIKTGDNSRYIQIFAGKNHRRLIEK